ncbi:Cytochrome P450 2B10, partial [Varanus komodoensis]
MRRFALTTLRNYGMGKRTIEDKIVEECGSLIKALESHGEGSERRASATDLRGREGTYGRKPVEGTTITNAAVSNIIVSILLGKRFEYDDARFLRLLKLVSENIRLAGSPSVSEEKSTSTGFFHKENLRAVVANLFAAGTETTSSTLHWGILLMMKYPDIQIATITVMPFTFEGLNDIDPGYLRDSFPPSDPACTRDQRYD